MALSDEQNAMLRLLAQGEQGYGDIAALLGLGEDEVRAKVVGALAQLEAEGKPAPDVPPPIPGGAKPAAEVTPPEPEPVSPEPEDEDDEPAVADAVAPKGAAKPRGATKPAAAKPKPQRDVPRKPSAGSTLAGGPPPSGGRTITLPSGRGAWLLGGGILAAIAIIVVVILLASGGGGGGGSSSTTPTEAAAPGAEAETGTGTAAEEGGAKEATGTAKKPTEAELVAVDGSKAKGLAIFGRFKNKLALQVEATELEPTAEGSSYSVWLAQSPKKMLPIVLGIAVKGSGKTAGTIAAQYEVPVEVLAYLANGTFDQIAITRTDTAQLETSIKEARTKKTTPTYLGEPVLRGTIVGPIVGIAKREAASEEAE